jgi:hypothetical protein
MNPSDLLFDTWVWRAWCVAVIFPIIAVLHHALFYRSSCMINPFGPDYTAPAMRAWLLRDPSVPWGMLAGIVLYLFGLAPHGAFVQLVVPSLVIGFAPLTVWIWDIPGSGRWICRRCHDDLIHVRPIGPLRTKHIYVLSAAMFVVTLVISLVRYR